MDNSANMLQLCRLCLVKDEVNIPIFEEQGDIRQIFLKISSCLPVKVSREDKLPKKICDGCSYKLDMLYEFWNTSANAEKQLLSWLGEAGMSAKMNDGHMSAVAQQIKPNETLVKEEELDPSDLHKEEDDEDEENEEKSYLFQQKLEENNAGPSATATSNEEEEPEPEQPPPKRARRTAAVKAAIAMDHDSDDDDDSGEPLTKVEDESEDSDCEDAEPAFVDAPSTSADDQPGPSGVGKDGADAPINGKLEIARQRKNKSKLKAKNENTNEMIPSRFSCKFCHIRTQEIINLHMKTHYVCKQCKRSFISEDSMIKHRNSRHFYNMICKVCNCSLDPVVMPEHEKRCKAKKTPIKSPPPVKLKCKKCSKIFKTTQGLDMHRESVHHQKIPKNRTQKPFTCKLCDRSFRTKLMFTMHKQQSHTKDIKFMCKFCYQGFKNSAELHAHSLYHNIKSARFCEVCSVSFPKNSGPEAHVCKFTK